MKTIKSLLFLVSFLLTLPCSENRAICIGKKWPYTPEGAFSASGYNNNDMFIILEWDMVFVRLGMDQQDFLLLDDIYNRFLDKIGTSFL